MNDAIITQASNEELIAEVTRRLKPQNQTFYSELCSLRERLIKAHNERDDAPFSNDYKDALAETIEALRKLKAFF